MKTSLTKLSSSFFLLTLSLTAAWAKPVAQVIEVKGNVITVSPDGQTSVLKVNQHLDDKAELMVEEGAFVTLNDYYDATYNLAGGSHLKFFDKSVQLKKGKIWIQSLKSKNPLALTTANGHVDYWKGEFITTFDQATSKTQVLVVAGDVEFSNILNKNMKYTVPGGSFSLLEPEIDNGTPRAPTKVGLSSLNTALSEFKHMPEKSKEVNAPAGRSIASTVENAPEKKAEIIFIKSNRMPASVGVGSAHSYYKKAVSKKVAKTTRDTEITSVVVNFYGVTPSSAKVLKTASFTPDMPRNPASVPVLNEVVPKIKTPDLENDPEFTHSLKSKMTQKPEYSKELENLIQDLKSY